jgi:hypothetical protein
MSNWHPLLTNVVLLLALPASLLLTLVLLSLPAYRNRR